MTKYIAKTCFFFYNYNKKKTTRHEGMGDVCSKPKRYNVAFNGLNITLKSRFQSTPALTAAILSAMKNALPQMEGGYDISGITRVFTDYKNDTEWPLHYRKQICDTINVLQFITCLPSTSLVTRSSRDVCTVGTGTSTQLLRVSRKR